MSGFQGRHGAAMDACTGRARDAERAGRPRYRWEKGSAQDWREARWRLWEEQNKPVTPEWLARHGWKS